MAWSRVDDSGYATPAALVLALAFATVAVAMMAGATQLLRASEAELERAQFEDVMDGLHLVAVAAVVRSGTSGPFTWTVGSDLGPAQIIAEAEAEKIGFAAAAALDEEVMEALDVRDPASLRARLLEEADSARARHVADLDTSPAWRECAASFISPYGQAEAPAYRGHAEPGGDEAAPAWRIGETWRLRVATTAGWRDDRIVRFTGDARRPAAIVTRRLSRTGSRGGECSKILSNVFGA